MQENFYELHIHIHSHYETQLSMYTFIHHMHALQDEIFAFFLLSGNPSILYK